MSSGGSSSSNIRQRKEAKLKATLSQDAIDAINNAFNADKNLLKLAQGSELVIKGNRITLPCSIVKDDRGNLYQIYSFLGEGAYGHVQFAENIKTKSVCAVKIQTTHGKIRGPQQKEAFARRLKLEESIMDKFNLLTGATVRTESVTTSRFGREFTEIESKFYTFMPLLKGIEFAKYLRKIIEDDSRASPESENESEKLSLSERASLSAPLSDHEDSTFIGTGIVRSDLSSNLGAILEHAHEVTNELMVLQDPNLSLRATSILLTVLKHSALSLAHIHSKNILHLDIKTENMFIDRDLKITFVDYGVSLELEPGRETLHVEDAHGTPGYISPEATHAAQHGGDLSVKSDIYSLGIVFKQLLSVLCNREITIPFTFENPQNLLRTDLLNKLADTVKAMTERDPSLRPSANELYELLLKFEETFKFEMSKQLSIAQNAGATEKILALHRELTGKPITKEEAIKILQEQGIPYREALKMAPALLARQHNLASASSHPASEPPIPKTASAASPLDSFAEVATSQADDPEAYLKQHPGDLVGALECLERKQPVTKAIATAFMQSCQKKRLISDYRSVIPIINKKYK